MQLHEDQGVAFGTWNDAASRLLYYAANALIATYIDPMGTIGDYGGGNGLLYNSLKNIDYTIIDLDVSKKNSKAFIHDNIVTHKGSYDSVIIKLVLHYLSDDEVKEMLGNIKAKKIIVCQFSNNGQNLKTKKQISEKSGEKTKNFRTKSDLRRLLIGFTEQANINYIVPTEFYRNRLGLDGAPAHKETLHIFTKTTANESDAE